MNTKASGTISEPPRPRLFERGADSPDREFIRSLNLNIRGIGESATLAIQEQCRTMAREGKPVTNFGLGQSPFPVPNPVVEALRLHAHQKDYLPVRGLPALRDAVASFHRRLDGIDASGSQVLVGPGSKELMFLLQIVYYGELILPSPCWVSYGPQARILGKQIKIVPTLPDERWRLKPDRLEAFLKAERDDSRPRILVLNYPGNPDGLTYSPGELEEIAAITRKWKMVVLSDEIYGQIHHRGEHVSIARFYPEGTILSSGLSKWCGAGGWRLGTMTFPRPLNWLLESMAFVASETYTSVSAPIQYAAVRAFEGGVDLERYLRNARRVLSGLGDRACRILRQAGIRLHEPEGGFYLFMDFEPILNSLKQKGITGSRSLCERLLTEASVAVLPGAVFERAEEELTARLSYVNFDGGSALAAGEAVAPHEKLTDAFFEHHCAHTLEGCRRIASWARAQ